MIVKGKLIATSDWSAVQEVLASKDTKGMILDVFDNERYTALLSSGMLYGSFLMPPYEAMSAAINGDINAYLGIYTTYLNSPEVVSNTTKIMKLLYLGFNVVIFIPSNVIEFGYHNIVIDNFRSAYGIGIECINRPYQYDERYDQGNLDLMYMFDALTIDEYATSEEFARVIPDQILDKIFNQLGLFTMEAKEQFFVDMRSRSNKGQPAQQVIDSCICAHHGVIQAFSEVN